MMKKKVKKIPKYSNGNSGTSVLDTILKNNEAPYVGSIKKAPMGGNLTGSPSMGTQNNGSSFSLESAAGTVGAAVPSIANAFGIKQGKAAGIFNTAGDLAQLIPGVGTFIDAGLKTVGAFMGNSAGYDKNSSSTSFNDIYEPGSGILSLFDNDDEARKKAAQIQNNNIAKIQTQGIKADYMDNPNVQVQPILAAEGGIMRKPVDAFVSKGELIYDPTTKKLRQVPGSKGKPNKADDVFARLYEGDVVISNSPTMLMANGKTPAQNLEGLVDREPREQEIHTDGFRASTPRMYKSNTLGAREMMIKKVLNWQEANKTKPQEYARFDGGGIAGINKYGYNKNMSDFAYWDKDKNEYKKEYLDWVKSLTEQDVRDIEAGKYGDMSEYFSKNKGKKLDVATAQKLMTDKKYGNWHKIGQAVVDNKIKTTEPKLAEQWQAKMSINGVGPLWQDMYKSNYPIDYTVAPIDMKLKTLPNPSAADGRRAARKHLSKQNTPNWLDEMSNLLPVIGLFDKYDWHTESSQITPPRFVPVNADPRPLLRAADESLAMARYDQANISPNTGAGMAYGLQAASNRAKAYADAYQWQQETNNKLVAQNAGIYNDWRKQRDAYATQAIADTRANEGAAQQMRDQAIKDAYEFQTGRRNDRWKLSMLEPLMKYAVDDNIWKNFKMV